MRARDVAELVALAAPWGGSCPFLRVAALATGLVRFGAGRRWRPVRRSSP